jgi:2-polyprenyl-3-methyl-5-hydroxy-6-metoxy-1,4-benzoquinol methylase
MKGVVPDPGSFLSSLSRTRLCQPEKRHKAAEDVFEEEFFASLYDCANPWSVSENFYLDRAVEVGGPVLDLGCGTGTLACGIAAKGLSVTGVDPAEAMLRVARTRPGGDKVNWIQSDAQSLRLRQRFNFIYMTGHAFQQLLTDEDAIAVLRTAAHHLGPEGKFVFETRNPAAEAWLSWTPERSERTVQSPEHGRISLFYDAEAEPITGIVTFREHYHLLDKGTHRVGCNRIRFVGQDHLVALLTKAGLAAVSWCGDWNGAPLSLTSKEIIVVTRRATPAASEYK